MRVAILRRSPKASFSMDVYANALVSGLKTVRPTWEIVEFAPELDRSGKKGKSLQQGLWSYYERYWRYPHAVKKQQADIFHIIDHSDGHIARWLKRNNRLGVVTCHDLINLIQPENVYDQARLPFVSMAAWKFAIGGMYQAKHIITVSSHTAQDVVRELKIEPERIAVVPNGVESIFRLLPQAEITFFREQNRVAPETLCLLNVGSNHPRKNVFTALKVIKALKDRELPTHFWKAGADFTVEQKKFIQTHCLENFVTYLGKPDKHTLVQIYNAADVLLSPSLYEGFGITILEAMACGTAVITSNITSLPEVAGDAAIMVDPTDILAMVKAVCRLQEEPSYRKSLVEAGLARAKLFSWEKTAEKVAQVYEKILNLR
ncbi:glycosyltransferase family 4 protein [Scytonema sp. NUACC26]|uniref:glycosyltransferase family 4 protein n=1 Tax=Scytonema sp. NUACC26 TaxID=3140176 RepID=UPI0034DCAF85